MVEDTPVQTPAIKAAPETGEEDRSTWDEPKWQHFAKQHERDNKKLRGELETANTKIQVGEDAQKTEAQKAADRAATAEQRATAAELKALRYEVGVEQKVPANLLRYLTGATKEELEANAAQLIADFGADTGSGTGAPPSGRPKEALRAGASAETVTADGNQAINDRIRQAARR